jgi:hypothetical protein
VEVVEAEVFVTSRRLRDTASAQCLPNHLKIEGSESVVCGHSLDAKYGVWYDPLGSVTTRSPAAEYACTHLPEHGVSALFYRNTMWLAEGGSDYTIEKEVSIRGSEYDSALFRAYLIAPEDGEYFFQLTITGYCQLSVEGQLLLTNTSRQEREVFTSTVPMLLMQNVLYEVTVRYAFLPSLPVDTYPVVPYLDLLWAGNGGPFEVIPVTSLLHSLENSQDFPVVLSVINDVSPCDDIVTVFPDLWNPDNGTIVDGSPLHDYNRDVSCRWSWAIKHGKRKLFRLYADLFDMEISPDCHYDGVIVRAGADADAAIIRTYCGFYEPGTLLYERIARGMFVEFYTDDLYEFQGIKLRWEVHDCETCDSGPRPVD